MTVQEELERQFYINLQLRRQLEKCRRDTVEYCAKFCEDNEVGYGPMAGWVVGIKAEGSNEHAGIGYAKALRGIIGV